MKCLVVITFVDHQRSLYQLAIGDSFGTLGGVGVINMASKPGKYVAFKKLYPKAPIEGGLWDKINMVLSASAFPEDPDNQIRIRDLNNTQLKDLYVQDRKAIDDLEARLSVLETRKTALTHLFIERMEDEDVTSLPFTDGVTIGASVEPYANVVDRVALLSWIKQTGLEELLTLNYQTLQSLVKASLLEGQPLPPGCDVFMRDKLSAKGLKGKGENTNDSGN